MSASILDPIVIDKTQKGGELINIRHLVIYHSADLKTYMKKQRGYFS